jgi:hypothetical protein
MQSGAQILPQLQEYEEKKTLLGEYLLIADDFSEEVNRTECHNYLQNRNFVYNSIHMTVRHACFIL